jgi:hypothetical protein
MLNTLILAVETGIDMAEVLRDTHAFYEGAWDKLVWTLGAGGAGLLVFITVVLVVVQVLIENSRRETLRVDQETIRRQIDEGVARARDMSLQQIAPTLSKLAESVQQTEREMQKTRKDLFRMTANTLHSFGGMSAQNRKYLAAASFIWTAAHHRCVLGESDMVIARTLDVARRALIQATVAEALDDSEPYEIMLQLSKWFSTRDLGPESRALLVQLKDQLVRFDKKYLEARTKQAERGPEEVS